MHKTALTARILLHLEIKILNPVLHITTTPPPSNHRPRGRIIPDIAYCFGDGVLDVGDVGEAGVWGRVAAGPGLDAAAGAESDGGVGGVFLG